MPLTRLRHGPIALVTGAAHGIGRAFAQQLAAAGFGLLLVDIDAAGLAELRGSLPDPAQVDLLCVDLRRDFLPALDAALQGQDLGLLIANAGSAGTGAFVDQPLAADLDVLDLNCRANLTLLHRLLPGLVARGRGGVVLVASTVAMNGGPYIANYAATKAYLLALGDALAVELRGTGVDLQVLAPGMTDTPGLRGSLDPATARFAPMRAEDVVSASLAALGDRHLVVPGALNRVATGLSRFLLPRRLRHLLLARKSIRPFTPD